MSPNRKAWKQGSFFTALAARGSRLGFPLLLLLALVMGAASPAPAAQVSFVSISGIWHDPVDNLPGSQPGDPVITNGTPTSSISWGQTSGTPQSGYDFTAVLPPPITFPGQSFSFGTFTHRNFSVSDPSLTSVQLDVVLVLDVDGVQTAPLTFTFTLNHEETPNNQTPCPYPTPTGEGCTDRVTIVSSAQPATFNVGGVDYTFALNFNVNGSPATEFITREGGIINSSGLDGNFVLPPPPSLTVAKSGPATMNLGQFGDFALDVLNTGTGAAWDVSLRDLLPDGATGGMCDLTPQIVGAQVFLADGVTPAPGKGPLALNVDYTLSYSAAPNCRLDITMQTTSGSIGANERLIIRYRTQLDSNTQSGVALTNIAGAIQWFNGPVGNPSRQAATRTLTNGTVGTADHEDAHIVTSALASYYFQKTVGNLTSGANPATTAAPGDRLHYRVRLYNVSQTFNGISISDLLNPNSFDLTTFAMVTPPPAGATYNFNSTNGLLTISGSTTPLNVAVGGELVIEFEITLKSTLTNGTAVDNQATLSATGITAYSDDPNVNGIALPGSPADPTRVVIQILGLVAQKTVSIAVDNNSNGLVDPGDVLLYTIAFNNLGDAPATDVVLIDDVPANTTYVANSVTLNGLPVKQPDGGISPLASGVAINSAGGTSGTIAAHSSAVVTFRVQVIAGVPTGTVISNQGYVTSYKLPTVPTDADGNPANGYQPTTIVVGNAQQLMIAKEVFVVSGGAALPGGELEYTVSVTNTGTAPATNLVITDNLTSLAGKVTYVAGSATFNSTTTGVSYTASTLTADYASTYGNLQPGTTATLRFRVLISNGLATGTRLTNTAQMAWNTPTLTATASVSIDIGGVSGSAMLNGQVWHDANLNKLYDAGDTNLAGWTVGIYRSNVLITSVTTDANGLYNFSGLEPTLTTVGRYELRFTAPGAGSNTASLGQGDSPFTNGPQRISDIIASSGANLQNLNLPITPNGAVYNSVQRTAVAGATLAMLNGATNAPLPSGCFDSPAQQNQITAADGFYKFDLNFSDVSCPAGGTYLIKVTSPGSGYAAAPSQIIPPSDSSVSFSVPACPGSAADAIPTTNDYCEVTASASVPPSSISARTNGTTYYLYLTLSNGRVPGQSQVFNNHIPIDPVLDGAVAITKTSSLINVTRGQLVPYTITVTNVSNAPLSDLIIRDLFPAGFKYVEGSARLDNNPSEPSISGRELKWNNISLQLNESHTLRLLLVVGAGVSEGEYVNRAQVLSSDTGGSVSGEATATVRVIPDPTFDCTDVIGKVFDDRNLNGQQDAGERGLSGVRVVTARGLIATSDEYGRFNIICAVVPDEIRGSSFIVKLDERTLPTGYRVTTENPRVQRATRGKMLRFNFGATIHHVVSMDISDGAFEPKSTELRIQWHPRIDLLLKELRKAPSVLRLSYLADVENEGLVKIRLKALKKEISDKWDGGSRLTIETEVFWRRGSPP